jgi:hypothetical protein
VRHPGWPKFELKEVHGAGAKSRYDAVAFDRERIVAEYGENFLAPTLHLGDSLVFSQDVIHRTHITPQMTEPRIGFEFRVFSLKHLAPWASADEVKKMAYPLV